MQQKICSPSDTACHTNAANLNAADYLDINYDSISHALVVTVYRSESCATGGWDEEFRYPGAASKLEVGVLTNEKTIEPEDNSFGGFLTVVGKDTKPSISPITFCSLEFLLTIPTRPDPTFFSSPSRHHPSPPNSGTTYHASFLTPTGLHPSLRLQLPSTSMQPPSPSCALHTYLTLPSSLFPDKYQLSSPLFLASKHLHALRSLAGETDLEAPNWIVSKWGSAMLMELAPPPQATQTDGSTEEESWTAEIPLHLRYLPPSPGGMTTISVPWPVVFWACPAEQSAKMSVNPFDRVNLGYDGLFGPRTIFYHLQPDLPVGSPLVARLNVPVLDSEHVAWIESGTVAAVLVAVVWVMVKLWGALDLDGGQERGRGKGKGKDGSDGQTRSVHVLDMDAAERRKQD